MSQAFGPIPCFSCLEADYSNSKTEMSFLLPYGELNATVKEKLKEKIPSLLELPVRPHYNIKEKFFYMYETFTSKK